MKARASVVARVICLIVLALGTLDLISQLVPRQVGVDELVADLRAGDPTIHVFTYSEPAELRVRWTAGFLATREIIEPLPGLSGEEARTEFLLQVQEDLGQNGREMRSDDVDPLRNLQGLSFLVPLAYLRFLSSAFLTWAVLLCCAGLLVTMAVREDSGHRSSSAGYWIGLCLLTGIGFLAYTWSEPRPLLRRRGSPGALGGGGLLASVALLTASVEASSGFSSSPVGDSALRPNAVGALCGQTSGRKRETWRLLTGWLGRLSSWGILICRRGSRHWRRSRSVFKRSSNVPLCDLPRSRRCPIWFLKELASSAP